MLTVDKIKSQIKVTLVSIKYALMREMLNKTSFIMNILFMIINNASFLIQWIILFSLKDNVAGYTFNQVLLLWGIGTGTYGFSHFFFRKAFSLSETIMHGKLDSYLVQPKSVLLAAITSDVEVAAIGDMLYGYIVLCIAGVTIQRLFLFTLFMVCGGTIMTAFAVILASLSFWIGRSDMIADTGNSMMVSFDTYPDGIFKGIIKAILFTIIPVGITTYIPVWVMTDFNIGLICVVVIATILVTLLAYMIFYKGLKRYSSTNLMISKI